jgi:uncharacterized membrane protein YeiB
MAALPLAKIFIVLFKEAAKPVAAQLREYATSHPVARRAAMAVGRSREQLAQRVEVAFAGHAVKSLKPISDAHALTVGADVVSQAFLLAVGVGLVVVEYWRADKAKRAQDAASAAVKAQRQAAKSARLAAIEQRLRALERAAGGGAEAAGEALTAAAAAAAAASHPGAAGAAAGDDDTLLAAAAAVGVPRDTFRSLLAQEQARLAAVAVLDRDKAAPR